VKLTILGCAGTFPGATSGCSSYLVEHDGYRVMIDCGNGATGALQRYGGLLDLDAVVLSHLHPDHCIDLIAYAYARFYHPKGRPGPLPVWGPADTRRRLASVGDKADGDWLDQVYDWKSYGQERFEVGPFAVEARRTAHPIECYALRVGAGGKTLAYSADTGPCDSLVQTAAGSDLFLCEASFVETDSNPPAVHLTGRQAGQAATDAGVSSLVLTHLVSWHDENVVLAEAKETFAGDIELARSGAVYTL